MWLKTNAIWTWIKICIHKMFCNMLQQKSTFPLFILKSWFKRSRIYVECMPCRNTNCVYLYLFCYVVYCFRYLFISAVRVGGGEYIMIFTIKFIGRANRLFFCISAISLKPHRSWWLIPSRQIWTGLTHMICYVTCIEFPCTRPVVMVKISHFLYPAKMFAGLSSTSSIISEMLKHCISPLVL